MMLLSPIKDGIWILPLITVAELTFGKYNMVTVVENAPSTQAELVDRPAPGGDKS